MAAILLILGASAGSAYAYFTTYATARGGRTIHLGDTTTWHEDFDSWTKQVSITLSKDSQPVFIRVKAFGPSEYELQYSGDEKWSPGADGYYYFSDVVQPGGTTSVLDIHIDNIPESVNIAEDIEFNVAVIYETTPARYNEDGTAYADWSAKVDTGVAEGGNE